MVACFGDCLGVPVAYCRDAQRMFWQLDLKTKQNFNEPLEKILLQKVSMCFMKYRVRVEDDDQRLYVLF